MADNRILTANFRLSRRVKTASLYQYDYGQVLRFLGISLPDVYEVHFSGSESGGEAVTVLGNADGVTIPDALLATGNTVHAWIFLHDAQTDGETEYKVDIPVVRRSRATGAEPTPVQQDIITQTVAALNAGVERAETLEDEWANMSAQAETLPEGSSATAAYSGGVLTIGVPTGATGATGPKGDRGSEGYRVSSLDSTALATGTVIEAEGRPAYVSDVTQYSAYGLTEKGWYVFARIAAPDGVTVDADTEVTGAAGSILTPGAAYADIAVRFGVAARSQRVGITWGGKTEEFVFKATDLAVDNLDYLTTFYIYDLDEFVTWTYALTTDTTFAADKAYYTESDGVYTLAEVTAGEAVPADTYYNHSKARFEGMTKNVTYKLDTMIDCPIEIALPEVDDDGYGAWFEIQMRYNSSYSCTLLPPEGVKVGTVSTQSQTAGVNVLDLQYTGVGGVKMWSLLNTHSNIPA